MTNIIRGTLGNDSLTGTSESDEFITYAGEDTVHAGDGDDYINSNETTLWANSGTLVAYGGSGNDKINATDDGDDQLFGEDGNDTLYGRGGDDTLDGGEGDDDLYGGEGDDTLDGGEGNDLLYDRSGNDTLYGRGGDDRIMTYGGSNALVYGGNGNDLINTTAISKYGTVKGTLIAYGEEGNDRIRGGSGGSNKLYGGEGDDTLWGNDGDDTLDGGEGDDDLYGGAGDDKFYYTNGSDEISGGEGEDSLTLNVAISELTNFEYNGLNVSFNINEDKVVTKSIENYYFGAQKYTFWELLIASQENSYLENYYLKAVQEKKEILERFSQDNFSPSSYIQSSLNNTISIFWPKEAVREYGSNVPEDYIFTSISDQEKIEFKKSLSYLSSYIDITFVDSDVYENSDVFVEKHVMTSGGYAASPYQGNQVPLALSSTITSIASLNQVFVHELGHVLRLDHPNDYIIIRDNNGSFSGWEKPENYKIPDYLDFNQFSVMSYLGGSIGFNWISDKNYSFAPLDIAYLEQYGTTDGTNTIFKLKIDEEKSDLIVSETATTIQVTPITNPFLLTDSGGTDQFTAIDIDIDTTLVFDLYRGYVGTDITTVNGKYALQTPLIEIYPSTIIENYTGHAGTDNFILGSIEVQIDASSGDDYFYVYELASSVINGGSGDDSIYFANDVEAYVISEAGSTVNIASEGTTYELTSIEKIYFDNKLFENPGAVTTYHTTSILVDKGILGASPVILEGLTENIEKNDGVTTNHIFSYNGSDYDYDDISPFIMIVVRDNEFTDDFRSELADFAPEFKDISYQDAVAAVGLVGISDAIITVAGADGNYIG